MPTALVLLAHQGFEEVEAFTACDVLTRGGFEVSTAGVGEGSICVSAYSKLHITPSMPVSEAATKKWDIIVLPGGMPGARILGEDQTVKELLATQKKNDKWIAAICAAPVEVLKKQGLLDDGAKVVCYPAMTEALGDSHAGKSVGDTHVDQAHKIISSSGPATAMEFGLAIVSTLVGASTADRVAAALLYNRA